MNDRTQRNTLGRSFEGAVCGKKLIAIGRPGVTEVDKAAKTIAPRCDEFGKPAEFSANARQVAIEINVGFPDLMAQTQEEPDANVRSCTQCVHYVGPKATEEKTAWTGGFCKAKGSLLLDDRLARYATRCQYRKAGSSGLADPWYGKDVLEKWEPKLLPEHQVRIPANSPVAILKAKKDAGLDPDLYPTDRPVGPRAQALGVRAWRRVRDQKEFGPDLYLPVFDIKSITEFPYPEWNMEIELAKIPQTSDPEHPGDYIDWGNFVYRVAVAWTKLEETPALWGPAGVGKTELFRHLGWIMRLPFERVSITGSSELDDLAGKMMYSPEQGTFFRYGRVPLAWMKPSILCVDEPNVGPPDVWQFFRPMTDNSKQLVLDMNKGERITAHKACYLGMAMNPAWDPRNVGAMELGDADGSRLMHVHVGYPPEEIEKAIILERLMKDRPSNLDGEALRREEARERDVVRTLMAVSKDLRSLSDNGAIPISWGIRNQIKVARFKRYMPWVDAFRAGAVDSLEPKQGQLILESVKSHCPEGE